MAQPLNKITDAARKTQFVSRMYDATTEILTPLKFLLPVTDFLRELLGMSNGSFEDTLTVNAWPSSVLTCEPAEPNATVLYANEARQLAEKLKSGQQMVAVVAAPGTGKSRVASALFTPEYTCEAQMLWFRGNSVESLIESIGNVLGNDPHAKLCIVLDEDHQAQRNESFFAEFFQKGWQTIQGKHQVVLTLRTGTYNNLISKSLVSGAEIIKLAGTAQHLQRPEVWGLDRSLTPEEQAWIIRTASDGDGPIIPFLIDRVCIPHIKAGNSLDDKATKFGNSVLMTVYQGLIACRPKVDQDLMKALCIAGQYGAFAPLWLITAVFRAMDNPLSPQDVDRELGRLESDGLIVRHKVELEPVAYSWRFVHDLLNDSLNDHLYQNRRQQVERARVEAAAVQLISDEAAKNLDAFSAGLAMWTAVTIKSHDGILPVLKALVDVSGAASFDNNSLLARVAKVVNYVHHEFVFPEHLAEPSMFEALKLIAGLCADHITASMTVDACENLELQSFGVGHVVARFGVACGELSEHAMWEMSQAGVEPLMRIGKVCTSIGTDEAFRKMDGFIPRMRYTQLMLYAGKWKEAGEAAELAIWEKAEENETSWQEALPRINYAACCYLGGNLHEEAAQAYERGAAALLNVDGGRHLAEMFSENAHVVRNWKTTPYNWMDIVAHWRRKFLTEVQNGVNPDVHILTPFPEHGAGSFIASKLEEQGLTCKLSYSSIIEHANELSLSSGLVFIGGHLAANMDQLMSGIVPAEEFSRMAVAIQMKPEFGKSEFKFGNQPGVWLAGHFPWETIAAVRYWLDNGGVNDFAWRVKAMKNANI